jgi:hypothetical protein
VARVEVDLDPDVKAAEKRQMIDETPMPLARKLTVKLRI